MSETLEERLTGLRPQGRLADYYRLRGSAGLFPQFAAVEAGLRPGMDCWIPSKNLGRFRQFVERQGLWCSVDCAFRKLDPTKDDNIIGVETLCTTHAIGLRPEDAGEDDEIHVLIAHTKDIARQLRACGWYPVAVNERIFHKPFVDHLEFGRLLGYPQCCIDFFEKSNNWTRTNSYAEACLNTTTFDYRTNCFGKNLGYSLSFHLPCRFDCEQTVRFSARVLQMLERTEPEYAGNCFELLRKPVLSLNEREVVLLDGAVTGPGQISYASAANLFATPKSELDAIKAGNTIEIRGRFVTVFRNKELVEVIECRCDEFGPKVPLLITWTDS
jgi:hypothetical protein